MSTNIPFNSIRLQLLAFLLTIIPLQAQEKTLETRLLSGALRKSALPDQSESVVLPLNSTFYGFMVELKIEGQPVRLILDTGAASTVLSPDAANRLGLNATEYKGSDFLDIAGSKLNIQQALTKRISLGGAWTKNEPVLITQMPKEVGDGVLGISTLADWDIRINPADKTLTLYPAGKAKPLKGETSLKLQCGAVPPLATAANPQGLRRMNLRIPVKLGQHEIMVTPDTGKAGTLLLSSVLLNNYLPDALQGASPALVRSKSVSGKMATRSARLPEFTLGTDTLRNLAISVLGVDAGSPHARTGSLGLNILCHYVMTLSISTGKMSLKSLGTVQEVTQASTAGLNMSRDANGRFILLSLTPGSPADKAGMMAGDELLEIEGRPLKTMKKEEFTALRKLPPGTSVKILYRRGQDEPKTTNIILIKR